jgi:peptidoglycan-associated lipoprotein
MKKLIMFVCIIALIIPGLIACQKKVVSQPTATPVAVSKPVVPTAPTGGIVGVPDLMYEKIYFAFDKAQLDKKAWDILNKKAEWLKANPKSSLIIEGNCDDRGTNEYNIALGWRRAENAKRYLIDVSGINPDRITVISNGEEKPTCAEKVEACWSKNRNDTFVVVK